MKSSEAKKTLSCPACNGLFSLDISDATEGALILCCPSCGSFLLVYAGISFKLNDNDLKEIAICKKLGNISALLKITGADNREKKTQKVVLFRPNRISKREMLLSHEGIMPERKNPIEKEEILNLIIDLNTTTTVEEFLSKIRDNV